MVAMGKSGFLAWVGPQSHISCTIEMLQRLHVTAKYCCCMGTLEYSAKGTNHGPTGSAFATLLKVKMVMAASEGFEAIDKQLQT